MTNLLTDSWKTMDSYELRLLLDKHVGGPGQYDGIDENPNKIYLPLAREACQIGLTYNRKEKITAIEPGPAFDAIKWRRSSEEIKNSILGGPLKVGRDYSFSGYRVSGSWRGERSGVQILPPPDDAPLGTWSGKNLRPRDAQSPEIKWAQQFYFAKLGEVVIDQLSPPAGEKLEELEPEEYFANVGYDGKGLRVPGDLDNSICLYLNLNEKNRAKFDRAAFWMDMASRQWANSASASFASLVTASESLTERGSIHRVYFETRDADSQHEVPGATERFHAFFEKYTPGESLRERRSRAE